MRSCGGKRRLAPVVLVLATLFCFLGTSAAVATTYYVDSVGGNDNWDGTSPSTAWRTMCWPRRTS